jgi:pilus assembly protein CpaE
MSSRTDKVVQILVALDGEVDRGAIESLVAHAPAVRVVDFLDLDGPTTSTSGNGDALVVAVADYTHAAREFVAAACRQQPGRPVVLVCPADRQGDVAGVLSSGVDDVVALPRSGEIDDGIERQLSFVLHKAITRRQGGITALEHHTSTVICVLGPKGGSGKTLTATNLAVSLAVGGHSVALLDLDLQFGDVALTLGVTPQRTLYDLVLSGGSLDAEKLAAYMVTHRSGVHAMLAPVRPDQAAMISVAFVDEVQRLLAETHDFVVIDTPPSFTPEVIGAIDFSTDVLMVAMRDTLALKNARLGLETLERMDYDPAHIRIVLNRANTNVGIEREDVLAILGRDVDTVLPSSREVAASINRGVPIALERGATAGAAFRRLASLYAEERVEAVVEEPTSAARSPRPPRAPRQPGQPRQSLILSMLRKRTAGSV